MPIISCCLLLGVPMVAEEVKYLFAPNDGSIFSDSFIVFCLSSSSRRLHRLSASLTARAYIKGGSVNCFCSDISYFYYMSVSCPSGLCFSASLPLVTSQARLESDVLEPQPVVTAGFRRMFQALGGQDRYPAVPSASLNRLDFM